MKPTLTIDDVVKLTSLSRSTVQVYASQKKVGTKIGAKRYFTKDDVKKLTASGSARKAAGTKKAGVKGARATVAGAKSPKKTAGRKPSAQKAVAGARNATGRSGPAGADKPTPVTRAVSSRAAAKPVLSQEPASTGSLPVQRRSFFSFLGFGRRQAAKPEGAGK